MEPERAGQRARGSQSEPERARMSQREPDSEPERARVSHREPERAGLLNSHTDLSKSERVWLKFHIFFN